MEDIEYLEEYEDLVLPALNSAAAEAAASSSSFETNKNQQNLQKIDDADDSSSSLDQDIFNCLFDDNSDDDYNEYPNSDCESALRTKTTSNEIYETLDDKFEEIGNTVVEKVEISRQDTPKKLNITSKPVNKISSTTTTIKPKGLVTKTSGTTSPLNTIKQQVSANKTKSVATVRPTVQNQLQTSLLKKTNLLQRPSSSSSTSSLKLQNPSTSAASKSYRTIRFPVAPPKSSSLLSVTSSSDKNLINKKLSFKRPATIVRPEKIITNEPVNDPLDLDDLSEADSDNYFSDISGESYNSDSDFDDDDDSNDEFNSCEEGDFYDDEGDIDDISSSSQIIELSNDSSSLRSKIEVKRAPTPSPVISDDSYSSGSSSGFILRKSQTIKPYSHPAIIESVLSKGAKPKLLELLQIYNLLEEDIVENIEEDNIIIDITTSRENLVENTDPQQQVTSSKQVSPPPTTVIVKPVDSTDNNKSLNLNTPDIKQTNNSNKTNKKKTKKKSLTNMDATNDYTTDSDLSAVEELLEESYAEAMKKVQIEPNPSQEMEAETLNSGEKEVVIVIDENEQKLPKTDVVIDNEEKCKEEEPENKTENIPQSNTEGNEKLNKKDDQIDKESKKMSESDKKEQKIDKQQKKDIENVNDLKLVTVSDECKDIAEVLEIDKSSGNDSQNTRKKKRFRNLLTPEPNEISSKEAKSMDDIKDFKGFEEHPKLNEKVEEMESESKPHNAKDCKENSSETPKSSEKSLPPESFKSPSKSHQSLKDKSKDVKNKSSQESSLDNKEQSSHKHSKSKSSSDTSTKDGSSRESSRDKSSRESSKDRSGERSKDRLKHSSRDKDYDKKHHHDRDYRRSCDSKDSSKSRESSKSRDSKELKDSFKSSSAKKHETLDSNKESSKDMKKYIKPLKETEKQSKGIVTSSSQSKSSQKDNYTKNSTKELNKSSILSKDNKSTDSPQKTSEKESSKSLKTDVQESKHNKDMRKSSSSSSSSTAINRDSSKDRKSTNKIEDISKTSKETKKPKETTDQNKSIKNKTINSTPSKSVEQQKISEQKKEVSKSLPVNVNKDKVVKTTNDNSKNPKAETDKTITQNPKISLAHSKADSKSVESDSKDSSKNIKQPSSVPQKTSKPEAQNKKDTSGTNKSSNEKKELDKTPNKSDSSNKMKTQTPIKQQSKETTCLGSGTKSSDTSSKRPSNSETKDSTKVSSENIQKPKTLVKTNEAKSKETSSDFKKPKETSKNSKELDTKMVSMSPDRSLDSKEKEIKKSVTSKEDTKRISMSPKRSLNSKEEGNKKPEASKGESIKKPEATKDTKSEDSKDLEKLATQNTKEKAIGKKCEDLKKESSISEKSESVVDENMLKKPEINVIKTKKMTTKTEDLNKTQNISDKQTVLKKDQSKEAPKKEVSISKTNVNATNKNTSSVSQKNVQTANKTPQGSDKPDTKKPTSTKDVTKDSESKSVKANQNETDKKEETKTSETEKKLKEQKTATIMPKKLPIKAGNLSDQATKKILAQSLSTNKDKLKGNVTTEENVDSKTAVSSLNKTEAIVSPLKTLKKSEATVSSPKAVKKSQSVSSPKTVKKSQATIPKIKTDVTKTAPKIQSTSQDTKTVDIANTEEKKNENSTTKETKSSSESDLEIKNIEAVEMKDVEVKEKQKDNLDKETKESQTNVKQSIADKPEDVKIIKSIDNKEKNPVSKKKEENDSSTISSKTKSLMETVLKKSVVILIEPLKSIHHHLVKNKDDDNEPRKTRSRNENIKEDNSKEEVSQNIEISEPLSSDDHNKNDNDEKTECEEETPQKAYLKKDAKKSETKVEETVHQKSENEDKIKTKQESNLETDTKLSGNRETIKEKLDLKGNAKKPQTRNEKTSNLKSETNKTETPVKKLHDQENESKQTEAYESVSEEKIKCEESNLKADLKTFKNNTHTESKDKSGEEIDSVKHNLEVIKSEQKADLKKENEKTPSKERSSERIQILKSTDVKSEAVSPTENKNKENPNENLKSEKDNLDTLKPKGNAELREESENKETYAEKTICKETSSEKIQTRKKAADIKTAEIKSELGDNKEKSLEKVECEDSNLKAIKTRQKTDTKTELKKCETIDKETSEKKSESKEHNVEQTKGIKETFNEEIKKKENKFEQIKNRQNVNLKTEGIESSKEKSELKPQQTRQKALKKEPSKFEIGDKATSDEKTANKELKSEPIKAIEKTDLKEESTKSENEGMKNESCEKVEYEESSIVPIRTRQKANLETQTKKSDIDESKEKIIKTKQKSDTKTKETQSRTKATEEIVCEESNFEPTKKKEKSDLEKEANESKADDTKEKPNKIKQKADSKTQEAKDKEIVESDESNFEQLKTRQNADLETGKSVSKTQETKSEEKSDEELECEKSNFEPIKTRLKADLKKQETKSEIKEKDKFDQNIECEESSFEQKKTRQKADLRTELKKSEADDAKEKPSKQIKADLKLQQSKSGISESKGKSEEIESEESNFEPIKTRQKADLETEEKSTKSEIKEKDKFDQNVECEGSSFEPKKTRQKADLRTELKKSEADDAKEKPSKQIKADLKLQQSKSEIIESKGKSEEKESEESNFEPIKTRQKADLETEEKSHEIELNETEKSADNDSTAEVKTKIVDKRRTRTCGDPKVESDTEKSQISSKSESSSQIESKDTRKTRQRTVNYEDEKNIKKQKEEEAEPTQEPIKGEIKTKERKNLKEKEKREIEPLEDSVQKDLSESVDPIKTRKHGDVKIENDETKKELFHAKASDEETKETRSENLKEKEKSEKEKSEIEPLEDSVQNDLSKSVEPIKTRKHGDVKIENDATKTELLQAKSSGEKTTETRNEHIEAIKTRRHVDSKEEVVNKKDEEKDLNMDDVFEPIKTRQRKDTKIGDEKEKNPTLRAENPVGEREHLTPSRTRKSGNVKVFKKETAEKSERAQINEDLKADLEKEPTEEKVSGLLEAAECSDLKSGIDKNEKCKEKISVQESAVHEETEKQRLEPRITRSRVDPKIEFVAESKNITEKSTVANVETCTEKELTQTFQEDLQMEKKYLEPNKDSKQIDPPNSAENMPVNSENNKIKSTADKKQIEKVTSDETEKNTTLRLIAEIDKLCQENSENEMSGFESSSSSTTDNSIKRTLRKRRAESPFPENDNNKKQFKEPLQKTVAHSTPKSTKTERAISNLSSVSTKRPLGSPALKTDSKTPYKVAKLETTTKKSTRFRNLQDDGPEEKLQVASAKDNEERKDKERTRKTSIEQQPEKKLDNETDGSSNKKHDSSSRTLKSNVLPETKSDAKNVPESTGQSKTSKTKLKTSPNKSPGSGSVLSFSEWLKTKSKDKPAESATTNQEKSKEKPAETAKTNKEKSKYKPVESATNEDTDSTEYLKRQSRGRARIIPQVEEASQAAQKETTMIFHGNEKASALKASQEVNTVLEEPKIADANNSKTLENMNVTQQLQASNNQLQNADKGQKSKRTNTNVNVKRLQNSSNKSKKTLKQKKSEIDLLIESMSKEMKEGGITNLLNTETHIKRQRLPNTRNLSDISFTTTPTREPRSLTTPGLQLTNSEHDKSLAIKKDAANRSPTRRKAPQNAAKSIKSTTLAHNDSSKRGGVNTPNVSSLTEQAVTPEDSKTQKSLSIKERTTTEVVKARKSMPILSSEPTSSLAKSNNFSSRKSLGNSKQPADVTDNSIFKMPKQTGQSILLNKIPSANAESIKKLYVDDRKQFDSRIKVHQIEQNLLKKFKCRKLHVRLDRTIVQKYLNSSNNRGKQTLTRKGAVSKKAATHILPVIQNNSETNLRIQSVVDASTIFNTSSPNVITNTKAFQPQNSRNIPVQIPAQSYNIPSESSSIGAPPTLPFLNEPFVLKNEFVDENPTGSMSEAILPDTPTLLARAQTITVAAQQALSKTVTPTDIRLLTTDSSENNVVPSFGVTPTALDNRGTRMYTFLHPAKYYKNHSNVLLDYCCPNLDGPMPAIDPTRIHAQVQVPIIELPASIVLTTKVVTRADLESGDITIPEIIRKKAEKIRKNMATHHKMAVSTVNTLTSTLATSPMAPTPRPSLPPTINALTKQLPSTTTITARIRPPVPQQSQLFVNQPQMPTLQPAVPNATIVSVIPKEHMSQLTAVQQSGIRSNLRRFDVLLKQLVQPYESLSFVERHRIIEAVIASGKCVPKDLEQTLVLMEEYIKQTMLLKNELHTKPTASPAPAIMSTNNYIAAQHPVVASLLPSTQMPQLQPSPKILASKVTPDTATTYSSQFEQTINKSVRKVQSKAKNTTSGTSDEVVITQRQVPIYDTDRNIIGYQMQLMTPASSTIPAYTKSTMSSHTGTIMSTSPDSSITAYKISKRPLKRPAQDSPRVFYTTPPLKTSTPKAINNTNIYPNQHSQTDNTKAHKSQGSIVTTVRSAGSSSSSASSETITTTTVKRVTRSTATGSKIIIVSKSNQSSEETILPDANQEATEHTEIKHEQDIDDFLG